MSALGIGFALYSNAFSSSIPSELGDMTSMTTGYYLCLNSLTNSLPSELGRMSLMTNGFQLYSNQVSCRELMQTDPYISHVLSVFPLCTLCSASQLSNSLPSEIGALTGLTSYLYLHKNSLSSSLP